MSAIITAVTLTAIGTGISAYSSVQAGKASQALNNYNASVTQQGANYNADLTLATADANAARVLQTADFNASVDSANATQALRDSNADAGLIRFNNRRVLASDRARIAASGVVGSSGSPLIAEVSQAGTLELRASQAEHAGQRRAQALMQEGLAGQWQASEQAKVMKWQALNEANMTRWSGQSQATLDTMQGSAAARAGYLNAASTLLNGAGKAASGYGGIS